MGGPKKRLFAALTTITIAAGVLVSGMQPAAAATTTTPSFLFGGLAVMPPTSTAYDRSLFNHWVDADGDGCDTRSEVLMATSLVPATTGAGCTVTGGQWYSWYDGATWTDPSSIDIDHLIPLEEAWKSGAWAWTPAQRQAFANELVFSGTLQAVTDTVNQSKGSRDVAGWLPALDQCRYLSEWVAVKWRWNLSIDSSEQGELNQRLNGGACGQQAMAMPGKADTAVAPQTGQFPTSGAIGAKYATASGVLGTTTSGETAGRNGGFYQLFERGTVAWTAAAGTYAVVNGINTVWTGIGAQNSDLGYPTSDEYAPMAGGVMQNFQYGKISWNPATGSRITKGGIGVTWDKAGGPLSGLGYPTTDEYSPMSGGIMQGFQYGKISWNAVTGSRISKGGIGATWDKVGGPTSGLGYPTTDEYATAHGGITQAFQYGQIVYSPATGSRFIKGGIGAVWLAAGGPNSYLGYPATDEIGGLVSGGAKQIFQRGQVIWSPRAGARILTGGIEAAWAGQGSERGRLGYPMTNEYAVSGGGFAQDYQGGRITWRPGSMRVEYAGGSNTPAPKPAPVPAPAPKPAPAPAPAPKPAPKPVPVYANCAAVRAAGAAPIRVGQPGYSRTLDRDGDGVACE